MRHDEMQAGSLVQYFRRGVKPGTRQLISDKREPGSSATSFSDFGDSELATQRSPFFHAVFNFKHRVANPLCFAARRSQPLRRPLEGSSDPIHGRHHSQPA